MTQFLVKFRIWVQVGPDDWQMCTKEKLFSEDTKLSEVKEWASANSGYEKMVNGYKRMTEIFLSEPQT
jgi:hypothetical protein